jgi:hypothetical protein
MYRTTAPITSLAGNGYRIKAHSNVSAAMFTPEQWDALTAEGVIVEVETKTDEPAKPAPKRKAKNA